MSFDIKKENKKLTKLIYARCKEIRKQSKITQKEFASLTSIPQSGIARIESRSNDVQVGTLATCLDPLGYKIQIVKK